MGILRSDRVSGLGGANAITGSTHFAGTADTGNYLRIDTGATEDFTFGTGDFTIEFWANSQGSGFQQHFYDGRGTTNSQRLLIYMDANNTIYYFGDNGARIQASSALPIRDWVHFALVRASGSTKMYFNGTQTGSTYSDTIDFLAPAQGNLFIGSNGGTDGIEPSGGGYFNGFLSNYRIVKGTAVYTANFTVPNTRLTAIDGTVLLTCTSSGNVSKTEGGNDVQPSAKNSNSTPPVASRFAPNSPVGFSTTTDVGSQYGITFEDNTKFDTFSYMVPPSGNTRERGRGRALIAGGTYGGGWGTKVNTISYIQIQSGGITKDFGDLSSLRTDISSVSSSTRAVFGGGSEGASANNAVNTIEFVTIASSSNVTDFGDLTSLRRPRGGVSNNTRGLFAGGEISPSSKAEVDHVTIATTGNATDFGDLSVSGIPNEGSSNSTRGVWMGGHPWGAQIEYVTIASSGSGADFGDVSDNRINAAGASSSTRALAAGGGTATNTIDYITLATLGDAVDFGDLTQGRRTQHGTSNGIRGIFCGGYTPDYDIIDSVIIATTGNAVNYGDLTTALREPDACSDSHGGLS